MGKAQYSDLVRPNSGILGFVILQRHRVSLSFFSRAQTDSLVCRSSCKIDGLIGIDRLDRETDDALTFTVQI